jgi:esterase/lipase superfamily enzyme
MPKYWMITDRAVANGEPGSQRGPLTYYVSDTEGSLDQFGNWAPVAADDFKKQLIAAADQFPSVAQGNNEDQLHVTFFVHGYNTDWKAAALRYQQICADVFSGAESMGLCISFDWPSCGSVIDYLPDRVHARECANDLAFVLNELFAWLMQKQQATQKDASQACKAKVSVISHSMGNYLLQKAMAAAWTRNNQPLLVSLINQLIMVAADVDNDLFEPTAPDGNDGNAVANLTYRISVLYSGRDAVLGASAGLKHFGTRRLGRSGLTQCPPTGKDNVWKVDCSSFFPATVGAMDIHSAYFVTKETLSLMSDILTGLDRSVLDAMGLTQGTAWPPPPPQTQPLSGTAAAPAGT